MLNYISEVFYHEDDYCQIELLPFENILLANNQQSNINTTISNLNDLENGFFSAFVRENVKYPILFLKIHKQVFHDILQKNATVKYENVYTGYSTERIYKKQTVAFGFENYVLFYEYDNEFISKVWISFILISGTLNQPPVKLEKALVEINTLGDIIIVDWNELLVVSLKNMTELNNYINNIL